MVRYDTDLESPDPNNHEGMNDAFGQHNDSAHSNAAGVGGADSMHGRDDSFQNYRGLVSGRNASTHTT